MTINLRKGPNIGKDRVHNIIGNRELFDLFALVGDWFDSGQQARARNILTFMKFRIQNNVKLVIVLTADWTNI